MKAYWLMNISRYRRTKAEAQGDSDGAFEEVTIPDKQQEMLDFLNGMIERQEKALAASDAAYLREEATAKELGYASLPAALEALRTLKEQDGEGAAPASPKPVAPSVQTPRSGDVIEDILELNETRILDAVGAALDRMHELVGFKGWHLFAKKTLAWGGGSLATDRGLGMLVLAGLASIAPPADDVG